MPVYLHEVEPQAAFRLTLVAERTDGAVLDQEIAAAEKWAREHEPSGSSLTVNFNSKTLAIWIPDLGWHRVVGPTEELEACEGQKLETILRRQLAEMGVKTRTGTG